MGLIGGGPGSFIGPVHRLAAEMDRQIELVAGTFSSEAARSIAGGAAPAYDTQFDGFAAQHVRGNRAARQAWAVDQLTLAVAASRRLGLPSHASFSGALAWPYFYLWPQRRAGLVEDAFAELARRWRPILDVFDANGVDIGFELHPGEDRPANARIMGIST